MEINKFLLMNLPLSTINITFLKDLNKSIKVDTRSEWRLHYCNALCFDDIYHFIQLLDNNSSFYNSYLIDPLIKSSCSGVSLKLSSAFLVNNRSNSKLISNFLIQQWENSGFDLNPKALHTFAFNYKKVWLSEL